MQGRQHTIYNNRQTPTRYLYRVLFAVCLQQEGSRAERGELQGADSTLPARGIQQTPD